MKVTLASLFKVKILNLRPRVEAVAVGLEEITPDSLSCLNLEIDSTSSDLGSRSCRGCPRQPILGLDSTSLALGIRFPVDRGGIHARC